MRTVLILTALALAACAEAPATATGEPVPTTTTSGPVAVAYLVRHAEKADGSDTAPLTDEGRIRAQILALTLESVPLDHVYSTDTVRTKATAAPTAGSKRLPVELYDAFTQTELADRILAEGGRSLIVGHSTSLGAMVDALGGDRSTGWSTDYDRFTVISVGADGGTQTSLLRYGIDPASIR